MKTTSALCTLAMTVGLVQFNAHAITIDPSYTSFGPLPQATFGGSGIPNDNVAKSEFTIDGYSVTLGLTATPRYDNPPLQNDGAGSFGALPGGDVSNGKPGYARWNVGYYVNINPEIMDYDPREFSLRLYYDKNGVIGNDVTTYLTIDPIFANGLTFDSENSLNSGMGSVFGPGFDPTVGGNYDFMLALFKGGDIVGTPAAINVNMSLSGEPLFRQVPDGGATAAMLGLGFAGCVAYRARRKS